jgi:hypothetical protein
LIYHSQLTSQYCLLNVLIPRIGLGMDSSLRVHIFMGIQGTMHSLGSSAMVKQ